MKRSRRVVQYRNGESCCGDCSHFEPVSLRRRTAKSGRGAEKAAEKTGTAGAASSVSGGGVVGGNAAAGASGTPEEEVTSRVRECGPTQSSAAERVAAPDQPGDAPPAPPVGWGVCELLAERLLSGGYPREAVLPHNADAASCPDFEALDAAELRARLRRWGRAA